MLFTLFSFAVSAQEICDNGIDDDGDGLVDLNDSDCDCAGFASTSTIPSLIPNSSFEDHSCCPTSYSQLNCADTWQQATSATSDYFNCGYNFGAATNAGITASDGSGYVGAIFSPGWQEYVGACLLQPMVTGQTYNLQMSIASFPMDGSGNVCGGGAITYDPIDISVYGAANCSSLPWSTQGCPSSSGGDWSFITSSNYVPASSWSTLTLTITPTQDINTIMIGSPCTLPGNYGGSCYPYFVFDNLQLVSSSALTNMTITESGDACAGTLNLDATIDTTGGTWQWYLDGVALVGQTSSNLDLSGNGLGAGTYQAVYTKGTKCDMTSYTVVTPGMPTAGFSASSVCDGQATTFTDMSTAPSGGSISSWQWDFNGDGIIDATGQNPSYTYPSDGSYTTVLVVTSAAGCVDTLMSGTGSSPGYNDGQFVTVNPLPQADFLVDSVCLNSLTSYFDLSTVSSGSITAWQWDFGDGSAFGTNQNESYTYGAPGNYSVELLVTSDNGCKDSITHVSQVFQLPVADFVINDVCDGDTYGFVDNSNAAQGTIDTWSWDYTSDGVVDDNTQNGSNLYPAAGTYNVTIGVTTDLGCFHDSTKTITVYDLPVPSFTATQECQNVATQFTDASTTPSGTITAWDWDFTGDAVTDDTQQNPTYVMGPSGSYSVALIVTNSNGCQASTTSSVVVDPLPVASFGWTDVCDGSAMNFTDQSSVSLGSITNYNWDFGDATGTSNTQNTSYTYAASGSYDVMLLVTSDQGCLDSITETVEVFPNPTVDFNFNNACSGSPVTFSDNSNINGASSATYNWDFTSDGTVDFTGTSTDNTYNSPASYFVTLDVTTSDGCSGQSTQEIVVFPNPVASFVGQNICQGGSVSFTNNSTITSGSIQDNFWDFGNGSVGNQANPTQAYPNEGLFYVTLIVTSDQGCEATSTETIEIYPNPNAQFITNDICDGSTANFTDISTVSNSYTNNSIVSWDWDLVTTTVQGQFASTIYSNPGTYTVTLDIETNHSCTDTYQQDITVYPNPQVSFTSPNPDGCTEWCPTINNASSISSGTINSYLWNLGDGTASTDENPVHCYTNNSLQTATYTVTLTATSDFGCATTVTTNDFITVYPLPVAAFGNDPLVGNIYQPSIQFIDSSLIADQYFWSFADLGSSTDASPSFVFPDQDSGTYEVCLNIETNYGCQDAICHDVYIEGVTNIYVPNSFTPNSDGINDIFMPSLYGVSEQFYEFRVFDRWGALVYETSDPNGYWDGTYMSEICMEDVYVWRVSVKDKYSGEILKYRGHVTLFR